MERVFLKFGLSVNANETTAEIIKKGVEAERLGLDYIWVSDVPVQRYAPAIASAVATHTDRIRIGVGLLSPLLYTPVQVADAFLTLVEVYGERFELCIGPGDRDQLARVGVSLHPPQGLRDYLLEAKKKIEKSLRKSRVNGRIWLGAQGPKMLEIARKFDGVLLNYAQPSLIEWAIRQIGPETKKDSRIGVYAPSYVYSKLSSDVYNLLRISSAVVALGAPQAVLRRLNLYGKICRTRKKLDQGLILESILEDVPEETIDYFSIFKSQAELKEYLGQLRRLGISHTVFGYPQNCSVETIRDLAQALKKTQNL